MTYDDFKNAIKNIHGNRSHKIKNSLGVYDAYKWIRKNKWLNIGRPLSEHEFYSIIRKVNNCLAEELVKGQDVTFPLRMGRLEIRKYTPKIYFDGNKVRTNLPIDWDRTLKLWYEDEESYKNKTLVKMEEKEVFKVYYNKSIADYTNKTFYTFNINRDLKTKLKKKIKEGRYDAYLLSKTK